MKLHKAVDCMVGGPALPDSPTITVYFGGGEGESPDIGVVRVVVPPGAGMPPHRHLGSDVVLVPVAGHVRITRGVESIDVHVGDAALIGRQETVSLSNPGEAEAELIVAAGPASFVAGIRAWPTREPVAV